MHTGSAERVDQEGIALPARLNSAWSKSSWPDCGCLQGGGLSAVTCVMPIPHVCSTLQAPPERQLSSSPPAEDVILILDSSDEDEVPAGPSLPPQPPGQAKGGQSGQRFGSTSPAGHPVLAAPATPQALQCPAASQQTPTRARLSPAAARAGKPSAGLPAAADARLSDSGDEGPASSHSKPSSLGQGTSQGHLVQPASPRASVSSKSQAQAAAPPEQSTGSGSPSGGSPCAATPQPPAGSLRCSSPARLSHNHPAPVAAVLATLAAPPSSSPCSSSSPRPAGPAAAAGPATAQTAGAPAAPGRPSSMAGRPGAGLAGSLLAGSPLMAPQGAQPATPGMMPTQQLQGGPSGSTRLLPPCPPRVANAELGQLSAFADIVAVSEPFRNSPEPSFHMTQPWNHTVSRPRPASTAQAGTQPARQASLSRPASTSRPGRLQQNGISGMAPQRQQATCPRPLPAGAVKPGEATPWQRRMDAGWARAIAAVERDYAQGPMDGFARK